MRRFPETDKPPGAAFSIYDDTVARSARRTHSGGLGALVPAKQRAKGLVKELSDSKRVRAEVLRDQSALGEPGYWTARPMVVLVLAKSA